MTHLSTSNSRRSFLKGLSLSAAGSMYLGPALSQMLQAAEGTARQRPRFLFVLEGNGLPPEQLHPQNLTFTPRENREQYQEFAIEAESLPASLQPVKDYADRMLILQGINGEVCGGGHSTSHGALGAYNSREGRAVHEATVDCVLGANAGTIFENVILGISQQDRDVIFNCSAFGPTQRAATICNPATAHDRIFGAIEGSSATQTQGMLLDFLQDDIKRTRRQLGGIEKEKLDAYLNAYEHIEARNKRIRAAGGKASDAVPEIDKLYSSEQPEEKLDAHFEVGTAALMTGLTDVVTIASGVGFRHFNIMFPRFASQSKHQIGHAVIAKQQDAIAEAEAIRAYHFSLIARTMRQLKQIPEGNGTMLDNTVIVYLSDAANTHHTRCEEWPYVLLGGAERLKLDGRYLQFPNRGQSGWRTVNTIHNTLLHAAGIPRDDFGHRIQGEDDDVQMGPLSQIFA